MKMLMMSMRFYPKWHCATSGDDVLARRFRLASNRYIVRESMNIKVFQYQVMTHNGLFEVSNEQHIFSEVFYNYVLKVHLRRFENLLYVDLHIKIIPLKFCITHSENSLVIYLSSL